MNVHYALTAVRFIYCFTFSRDPGYNGEVHQDSEPEEEQEGPLHGPFPCASDLDVRALVQGAPR